MQSLVVAEGSSVAQVADLNSGPPTLAATAPFGAWPSTGIAQPLPIELPDLGGLVVEPPLWAMNEAELACVQGLQVRREGIGHVTFRGEIDCRGLLEQLKDVLIIEQGEVVAYPVPSKKPPVGQGLNRPAQVVLFGCMPKSMSTLSDSRTRERYKQRVARMTVEKGAIFEDYNCEDGTWKFRVDHF